MRSRSTPGRFSIGLGSKRFVWGLVWSSVGPLMVAWSFLSRGERGRKETMMLRYGPFKCLIHNICSDMIINICRARGITTFSRPDAITRRRWCDMLLVRNLFLGSLSMWHPFLQACFGEDLQTRPCSCEKVIWRGHADVVPFSREVIADTIVSRNLFGERMMTCTILARSLYHMFLRTGHFPMASRACFQSVTSRNMPISSYIFVFSFYKLT